MSTQPRPARADERPLRVAEVNRAVRSSLEQAWRDLWIEGELSDVSRSAAGHVYFTLNDEKEPAQLRGVMFRGDVQRARAELRNGARVRLRGGLSLYEARGTFQLLARIALPAGAGDLAMEFRRIGRKLKAEGLFAAERKRPLPRLPRVIGVVTSAQGAALQDVVRVARRRCPVRLVVADCRVQGDGAAATIAWALHDIERLPDLDVVILTRGGGSAEDLWAFNDESVARAVAACRVPVVTGIGHQTDVTIADLVADVRAATPSNAAERVVPDRAALVAEVEAMHRALERAMEARLDRGRLALERARRLGDPRRGLANARREVEALGARAARAQRRALDARRTALRELGARLGRHDPRAGLARDRQRWAELRRRLDASIAPAVGARRRTLDAAAARVGAFPRDLERRRATLSELAARLDAMSPVKVLARGYAIALHEGTGRALLRADDAAPGDVLDVRLSVGRVRARVEGE